MGEHMFSDKVKTRIAGLALAGAALAAIPAAVSAGVVVKSTGPSAGTYPVGRQVADSATITLRTGDRITILTQRGTRVMQGPGTFRVGEGATRTTRRFSSLTQRGNSGRVRTGTVRGGEEGDAAPQTPPLIWDVDVAVEGTICLNDLSSVRMWRADQTSAQTFTITDQTSQASLAVPFVGTEPFRSLDPEGLAITDGGEYTITTPASEDAAPSSVSVKFVLLSGEFPNEEALAQGLVENGCMVQLTRLADELEATATR